MTHDPHAPRPPHRDPAGGGPALGEGGSAGQATSAVQRTLPPDEVWKQTVRDIYVELHFGCDSVFRGQRQLARRIVSMIEAQHPDFFCAAEETTDAG